MQMPIREEPDEKASLYIRSQQNGWLHNYTQPNTSSHAYSLTAIDGDRHFEDDFDLVLAFR
jgi:hypothetical protein